MKNRAHTIKIALVTAGLFALGLAATGGLGRVADAVSSTAHAHPGPSSCDTDDLAGRWGYSYHGELTGIGKLVGAGVETFDHNGHSVGKDMFAVDGYGAHLAFTGQFTLGADCTGHAVLNFEDGT